MSGFFLEYSTDYLLKKMEVCSLEDDDYEGLFITQSDKNDQCSENVGKTAFLEIRWISVHHWQH